MLQISLKYSFCYALTKLFFGIIAITLIATPALAANMSGWSDKTVCRLLTEKPDNAEVVAEAQQRGLVCGSGANLSGKKQQAGVKSIPKNQGIVLYALNMPPKLKEQLLSQPIIKTEFDFSPYQLAVLDVPVSCRFELRRVIYDDKPEGQIENWAMATGWLNIASDGVKIKGKWRMGGLSKDPGYLENEVNLKLTKAGHLVGKMAFFLLNVTSGEVVEKPLYVELKAHKRSQPLDLKNLGKAELWTDVEDWAGGVWFLANCQESKFGEKYDRSVAGMNLRFECLNDYAKANAITGLPSKIEIAALIANLEGVTFYRSHRQIVKAGVSQKAVDLNKAALLRIVNFEGTNKAYCAKPGMYLKPQ